MTNSYRDYKTNFINNLPSGVTYDSTLGRFFFNGKKFYTAQSVIWYRDYILKYDPDAVVVEYVLFIPSGSDSLITSSGDTFKVREA